MEHQKTIFIACGEASGDYLGAALMRELTRRHPTVRFVGIGGPLMKEAGLDHSLFPMDDLSIMGITGIFGKLFSLIKNLRSTRRFILNTKPDLVITIDASAFYHRLAKSVKTRDPSIPWIHYNAPAVWASRPKRAARIAKFLDHLLCLLPFEPPYFTRHGLKATFVGHPLVEEVIDNAPPLKVEGTPITILFGSRSAEIKLLTEPFLQACKHLQSDYPDLHLLIPTFEHYKPHIKEQLVDHTIPYTFIEPSQKHAALTVSRAALVASGTVALEVARAGTPFVVGYKLSWLSYQIAKRIVITPYVCLINILLKKPLVAECLQHACNAEVLCAEMKKLLILNEKEKKNLEKDLHAAFNMLKSPRGNATSMVVDIVENYIEKKLEKQGGDGVCIV